MRSRSTSRLTRVACVVSASTILTIGPIGCDGGSAPPTGTASQLPPEAKQANDNMENFMKNQPAKK